MNAKKLVSMGFAAVTMLFVLGCETELDTMKVKEIRFSQSALEIQELSERVLTANLLPDFAGIAARINDITVGTPPAGLTDEEQAAWTADREAVVAANLALVTWESDDPAVATVTKAAGSQLQATVKAVGVKSGENQSLVNIRVVIAEEGVAATAAITVIPATQYTLKVKNNSTTPDTTTTGATTAILTWKGENWDGTEVTTVNPPPGAGAVPYTLTIVNNDANAHIGSAGNSNANDVSIGGHIVNSTMVYLAEGIRPPFVFKVTLNLKTVTGTATNSGVMVWISRDADTPSTALGPKLSYRHAGTRWFGDNKLRSVFPDSVVVIGSGDSPATNLPVGSPYSNMRNIQEPVTFNINRIVTLEVEHTGEHYIMRYPLAASVSDTGFTNAVQKIHADMVDPNAEYFPGFHVSGATVEVTGISLIRN